MTFLRRTIPALLTAAACLLPAASASADGIGRGTPWPKGQPIRVYNAAKPDQKALGLAIAAWNGAGARIRFVQVRSPRRAQVIVRYDTGGTVPLCGMGWGSIGWPGPGGVAQVLIKRGTPSDGQACAWPGQATVLTHELGHVLGFGHVSRCSVMAPLVSEGRGAKPCVPVPSAQSPYANIDARGRWRCGLLEPFDVQRLVARYGGRARPRHADPWCDVYAPIDAPAITATREDVPDGLGGTTPTMRIAIVRPADPAMPDFVARDRRLAAQGLKSTFLLYRTAVSCLSERPENPFAPPDGVVGLVRPGWTVEPGGTEVVQDAISGVSGTVCYTVWAVDSRARPGRLAGRVTVTI